MPISVFFIPWISMVNQSRYRSTDVLYSTASKKRIKIGILFSVSFNLNRSKQTYIFYHSISMSLVIHTWVLFSKYQYLSRVSSIIKFPSGSTLVWGSRSWTSGSWGMVDFRFGKLKSKNKYYKIWFINNSKNLQLESFSSQNWMNSIIVWICFTFSLYSDLLNIP